MFHFIFAQAAVATASGGGGNDPGGLSLGAWLAIVSTAIGIATLLIKFGELKANARHLEDDMNKALAAIRVNVEEELKDLGKRLDQVLDFIHESQQQRVLDAGWQERTTAAMNAAAKDATEAKDAAHSARNVITQALLTMAKGGTT